MARGSIHNLIETDEATMGPSIPLQSWALFKRYLITLLRYPISSLFRVLLWPGFVIGLGIYMMNSIEDGDSFLKSFNPLSLVAPVITWLTVFHAYHFTEWMVNDKSTGIKSLMISMGLKPISYYLANSMSFIICVMPLIVTVGVLMLKYLMPAPETPYIAIMMIAILFVFHLLGWVFVFASFITSTTYSPLAFLIIFIEPFVHQGIVWLMKKSTKTGRPFVLFMGSFSPYESLRILCDSYTLCKNCETTMFDEEKKLVAQPVYLILLAMVLWTIMTFAFARWFDEVCCWQTNSPVKNPFFCFKREPYDYHEVSEESPLQSRYFEKPAGQREVGICVSKVSKTYGNTAVVDNLSFNIFKGETTLLLGHNGAGKTTLMNIILNKLTPDGGKVLIKQSGAMTTSRGSVGVCPQTSVLDINLNVKQHLDLFANIKTSGMSSHDLGLHVKSTIEDVSLTSHIYKLPGELSGGMKRKLSLAMAFVGKSQILVLDEPSSGLDPDSRVSVWNVIRRYRNDRTVLLSTQHMEEADYLGDRIAIMSSGRLICCGSSAFLNGIFGNGYKLRVECRRSKQKQILAFVRKYFETAFLSEVDQSVSPPSSSSKEDPTHDMVIELTDDKSKDSEIQIIRMLEEIESHSHDLHIISHGLKSSSLEDVLLNTSKVFEDTSPESTKISLAATSGHISTLSNPSVMSSQGCLSDFRLFLLAFLVKHRHTYRRDWKSILIFRVVLPTLSAWFFIEQLNWPVSDFSQDFLSVFMIVHFIHYPTLERVSKFKIVQLTSHATFMSYWTSQYLIDLGSILVLVFDINLFLVVTFRGEFISSRIGVHSIATLSIILFGTSAAFLAYLISGILKNSRTSVGYNILIYSIGIVASIILFILTAFVSENFKKIQDVFNPFLIAVLPTNSLKYVYYGLNANCFVKYPAPVAGIVPDCQEVGFWSPVSAGIAALLGQILVYGIVLYMIEHANINLSSSFDLRDLCGCRMKASIDVKHEIDQDVLDESSKVASIIDDVPNENYSLVAADLSKSYRKGVKVVNHLSFAVNKGECFGLLGVNGAGKTSTFSMIVAEISPDEGQIWMNGCYLTQNVDKYRHKVGYDPQECPEFSLSPIEALHLMARLRRINEKNIPMLVSSVLELLDMTEHAAKSAYDLSGGTKRKLSLGMSLIGNASLLALDEPTAGVDPIARRSIWNLLRSLRLRNGSSIIISSHAMEECEAICDRISIMAWGRLRCIGSFLHLRSKFAKGCSVRVHFSTSGLSEIEGGIAEIINKVISELSQQLKTIVGSDKVILSDTNISSATFNILDNSVKRSSLFKILRELRHDHPGMSYTINDSSLEDIFIGLAREQQELDKAQGGPK